MHEHLQKAEINMKKTLELLSKDFAGLRAGRATPALLDKIKVDYYGTPTPVNQLATISVPEAQMLVVQPWDGNILPDIEKAILKSELGITPTSDGNIIRLVMPTLTEERRKEFAKYLKKRGEEAKVAIRNIRRDALEQLKALKDEGGFSEDELHREQEEAQKITDKYIKEVDQIVAEKEEEIMSL